MKLPRLPRTLLHSIRGQSIRRIGLLLALSGFAEGQSPLWLERIGSHALDRPRAAAPDGAGGAFMSGETAGSFGGPNAGRDDIWLGRFHSDGSQGWLRQFGTQADDRAYGAAPDGSGGSFFCGETRGDLAGPSAGLNDAWVARYDSAGNRMWLEQFGSFSTDTALAVATDGSDGVYVGGWSIGSHGGPWLGAQDAWLARYDGAGTQLWIRQFGTTSTDRVHGLTPDGVGGVFACGETDGSYSGPQNGNGDPWLARYNGAGTLLWKRQFGSNFEDLANAIAPDGAGGVYVAGETKASIGGIFVGLRDVWLARYDADGNRIWILQIGTPVDEFTSTLTSDGTGGVHWSGRSSGPLAGSGTSGGVWLAHYDRAGNQIRITHFATTVAVFVHAASADGTGGVILAGTTFGSFPGTPLDSIDVWLARFESDPIHTRYCSPAISNSTGLPAELNVRGSLYAAANDITLMASNLPPSTFGYFLVSNGISILPNFSGSMGTLCLGTPLGFLHSANRIQNSGASGFYELPIDLSALPTSSVPVAVQAGDTRYFQSWYRDKHPGSTSNFTDMLSIVFE